MRRTCGTKTANLLNPSDPAAKRRPQLAGQIINVEGLVGAVIGWVGECLAGPRRPVVPCQTLPGFSEHHFDAGNGYRELQFGAGPGV